MIAYHYTVGIKMPFILLSGPIKPKNGGIKAGDRPLAWFSTSSEWEPTATKMTDGDRNMTIKEMMTDAGGLFRIAVDTEMLIPWKDAPRKARMKPQFVKALEAVAKDQGSDPSNWWASLNPIKLEATLSIEEFDGTNWVKVERSR